MPRAHGSGLELNWARASGGKVRYPSATAVAMVLLVAPVVTTAGETIGVLAVADPPGPTAELAGATAQLRALLAERTDGVLSASALQERMMAKPSPGMLQDLDRAYAGAVGRYDSADFEGGAQALGAVDACHAAPRARGTRAGQTWRSPGRPGTPAARRPRPQSGSRAASARLHQDRGRSTDQDQVSPHAQAHHRRTGWGAHLRRRSRGRDGTAGPRSTKRLVSGGGGTRGG